MEEFFELIDKHKLNSDDGIEKSILNNWSRKRILDFNNKLLEVIDSPTILKEPINDISSYSFIANSHMSAQHGHCPAWPCRLKRIEELAIFSSLYSDHVFINNYFEYYNDMEASELPERELRYHFAGDLKIVSKIRPLLTSGIMRFVKPSVPGLHICPTCAEKYIPNFPTINKSVEKLFEELVDKYLKDTSAKLDLNVSASQDDYNSYHVEFPQDFDDHGENMFVSREDMPKTLRKRITKTTKNMDVSLNLTKQEIREAGIIQSYLSDAVKDVWTQNLISRSAGLNVKYLTDQDVDVSFLNAMTDSHHFQQYNTILKSRFIYELPILTNVPLSEILKIRENEYESFVVYRDSINKIVNEYISKGKDISQSEAIQLYEDLVRPNLNKLDLRVKQIKKTLWRKTARDIGILTGLLTIGLFSGIITPAIAAIIGSIGGYSPIKKMIDTTLDAIGDPEEVRNDNFYFLWKLSKTKRN